MSAWQVSTRRENQLAVEEELRRMRADGDAVKKQLQQKVERELAVEQELALMRLERNAANDRLDKLAKEMQCFQQQLLGNRSETAVAPSAPPIGSMSPPAPPSPTEIDIEDLVDYNLLN